MDRMGTVLLIGGTGKTGRRLYDRITARGDTARVASRSAKQRFIWEDEGTWEPALNGVDSVYVAHHDITHPDAGEQLKRFSQLALSRGVKRQVFLSGRAAGGFLSGVEDSMKAADADWTILRPAWFMQNFSEMFFFDAVLKGEIALPVGDATEPFIDVEDVAAVAAAAFLYDRHIGQTYELTGPRLIGFAEAANDLTKAIGRKIIFSPMTLEEFRDSLRRSGLPEEYGEIYSGITDGKLAFCTDHVQQVLGRPPGEFVEYARRTAATGVWDV